MVTLEAHAAGLPVIAADSPAARELIRHGVDGLRYDPRVPGALGGAVGLLADDPSMREEMGRHALQAVSGATWRHATHILREHYLRACRLVRDSDRPRPDGDAAASLVALAAQEAAEPPREAV
jgi:glycosyltransferase involved in cell wall biosynthesis